MDRSGADALPIVLIVNLLIGFVMGFQSAVQLKQFGANIFVADLVGLGITRELGPLMTAIIVCGRSGAAFAAELGTMKVSEEIDALRTMGISPLRFLVFPRIFGLFLVMPILTLFGDVMGIAGGLLVGVLSLDLTISGYVTETRQSVHLWDFFQGLIKCGFFAVAIGIISSRGWRPLAAPRASDGAQPPLVSSPFALILVDAGFTVLL